MNEVLIQVRDLKIHFAVREGVVKAVDGVSFDLKRAQTLCIVGESGSGKSVSARALLRITENAGGVTGGSIVYYPREGGSVDIAQLHLHGEEIRRIRGKEIAMIFQEPMTSLSPLHTVGDQIIEMIRLHEGVSKKEARQRTIELLRRVGIPHPERRIDEYPFRLSGGMRQRCMIAMALSCNPNVLIADEPTTALDVTTQAQILDLMRELQAEYGMALLFITHDLGVVAEVADEVAVMYLGNIVEIGDVDTIFNAPKHPYTQALLRSMPKITSHRERLNPIQGMVPSPFARPSGCPFHPRCDQAVAGLCAGTVPEMLTVGAHHQVRCLLYRSEIVEAPHAGQS